MFENKKKVFVIAEVANTHEGNLDYAKQLTNEAYKAGVDGIKFQKFSASKLVESSHPDFSLYKKLEFLSKDWHELIEHAKQLGLKVFVDIFDLQSAQFIQKLKVDGFKIHSSDITNPVILKYLSKLSIPVLLSTAGCYPNEIAESIKSLKQTKKEIILMHGFQGFPTKINDINLQRIVNLKKSFDLPIGISDHIAGDSPVAQIIPLLTLPFGISVIEKHITLDRTKKGIDYYSSLEPLQFKKFVKLIRLSEQSLGKFEFDFSKAELKYRSSFKKLPISKKIIPKETKLSPYLFEYLRTSKNYESLPYYDFNSRVTKKTIFKHKPLTKQAFGKSLYKVAAIIACRVDSTRLYAKPLQNVGNYSILYLLLKQIKKSKFIDDIVLAISNKKGNEIFIDFALQNNLKFIIGDDKDVLQRLIDGAKFVDADIVFRKTSENPFIYWEGIDKLIKNHIEGKYDYSSYGEKLPLGSEFEVINKNALEISHKLGKSRHRSELCALYIMENQKKFKIQKILPAEELIKPQIRITVDTPEDLIVAQRIHESLGKEDKPIPLKSIISFLEKNPHIMKINSNIPIGVSRLNL